MGKRVLIMEDEFCIREILVDIFETMGYDVLSAVNGTQGMEAMANSNVDLVITDRTMPGGPLGEEVVRRIKAEHPGVKVVFMTGETTPQIMMAARAAGADATLLKPFKVEEMERVVQELLK